MTTLSTGGRAAIAIHDVWPSQATYRPGEPAAIYIALDNDGAHERHARLALRVAWLDETIATLGRTIMLPVGGVTVTIPLELPPHPWRGYGVDVALLDDAGGLLDESGTALDVLDDWTVAPRYGFLSDFSPEEMPSTAAVDTLARYHINVVQFYDWMWRHYALMPPTEEFSDALGRRLSLRTVRDRVHACHAHGMAALGYAAVYGAEPEYALQHPDELLYDESGEPYSLEKLFYIMNIHQGGSWRVRILNEMAGAVRDVPFDGLHLDQYGFPKQRAFGPPPQSAPYDLSSDFPPFIDDARTAVRAARPGTRVIFNAVDNWPIETVAPTTQDATYIEVWPPYDTYGDLQTLIHEARSLAPHKQVILAAYMKPLQGASGEALAAAQSATRLASAAIWANGGFHLLIGEHNGALCDPYYPAYATLAPDFTRVMRRYYDFVVRYENVLSDPTMVALTPDRALETVQVHGVAASPLAEAGKVWVVVRRMLGRLTISLINLTGAVEPNWNVPQPIPALLEDLEVEIRVDGTVSSVFGVSPDATQLAARDLPCTVVHRAGRPWLGVRLSQLAYWSLLVVTTEPDPID